MTKGKGLRGLVFAATDGLPKADKDKIANWVQNAGGEYRSKHAADVTHLIVSHYAWNLKKSQHEELSSTSLARSTPKKQLTAIQSAESDEISRVI